jgi:hypothetical protein
MMRSIRVVLMLASLCLPGCRHSTVSSRPPAAPPLAVPVVDQPVVPFEPIELQRIDLPAPIGDASTPTWTVDGHHLLFTSLGGTANGHLYLVGEDGSGLRCLSCGLVNEPVVAPSEQEAMAYALPDGKRAFFGPYASFSILECTPSLLDCATAQILPIDVSAARPTWPPLDLGGGSAPHMAPDGVHLAFSDVRTDAAELMVIGTLVRQDNQYVLTDPRVINPPGPSSLLDTRPDGWSHGGQLYEFKSFADGGASATYVAEPDSGNPDVVKVDLATGETTRLTAHPDWDEDNAPSPDGRSLVVESDKTMHRTDMFGLMPVRSFIDTPFIAVNAMYYVGSPERRQCDLQPWLLPASGDQDGALMGQPLNPYRGGDVHAANNVTGTPQWSPDGTRIALNLMRYSTALSPPYLLIAHLTARIPSEPLPVVSSQPGAWAVAPADYHGGLQSEQPVVVQGASSGNALLLYSGLGVAGGQNLAIYDHYSDDGKNFVDGTAVITNGIGFEVALQGFLQAETHLTLSGEHSGSLDMDLRYLAKGGNGPSSATVSGTATASYDGISRSGPPVIPQPCPDALPRPHPLAIAATVAGDALQVQVTSRIAGAGRNEGLVDTRPVWGATVSVAGQTATTDRAGRAVLPKPMQVSGATISAVAGDTMLPATLHVEWPP